MKNRFFAVALVFVVFTAVSCLKDDSCNPKTVQSETGTMQLYASTNNMNATADASGIYYEIIAQGSGPAPDVNSKIFIRYTGKYMDGTIFDQVTDHTLTGWYLGSLIAGWQLGLPKINEGGHIKLIIPSSLAYGCVGNGPIPANAVLFFEIQLIDVQ